jgi:predicted dehydrogenase
MIRAIQAGVGWWGMRWINAFTPPVRGVDMVGYVARSDKSKANLAGAGIGADRVFPTLTAAAHATDPVLCIISTKTPAHYPLIKEALGLGLHVLTEKPFTSTVAEARELVELAEARHLFLGIAENYRFDPAAIEAHRLMRAGTFGAPTRLRCDFRMHLRTMGFDYPYPEISDPILSDYGIHIFELMRWLLADRPRRVSARSWNLPGNTLAGTPIAMATVEFERGTMATLDGSYLSTGKPTAWGGEWTMDMAEGEIWWTSRDGNDRIVLTPLGGATREIELGPQAYPETSSSTLETMVTAIESGREPDTFVAGRDNILSLAVSEAAILSASRRGDWVELSEVL